MKKYALRNYSTKFRQLYYKEKLKLIKFLPKNLKIEHIGSTAVPKLKGKGIIDIVIAVDKKQIKKIRDKLIKHGYIFKPKAGDRNRLFFEKDYKYKKIRRVHLHLTYFNSIVWKNTLFIRDYLRNNPKKCKEYENIKRKAVIKAKGEGKNYRKFKKSFLDKLR